MSVNEFIRETTIIPVLKAAAAKHYTAYESEVGGMSCGRHLAEHISSRATEHKRKFNEMMDRLAKIDPECPTMRL